MSTSTPAPEVRGPDGPPQSNRWRTGFIILAIVLALVLIGAIVFGVLGARGSAPSPSPSPTPSASAGPSPSPSASPSPSPSAGGACATDQLRIEAGEAEGAAGSTTLPLIFTNTSSSECSISGFPQVAFVGDENGTQIGAPAIPATSSTVTTIRLAANDAVQATLTIETAANVEGCDVQPTDGFRVFPPDAAAADFIATTDYEACSNDDIQLLTIGAVTAG